MSAVALQGISKSFGRAQILHEVSLSVESGSTTAVVGSSGCGKTTLLRVIAGFEAPDAGSVSIAGECVADQGRSVPPHRRNVGYVAQDGALFPHLSVAQNIAYGLRGGPMRRKAVRSQVHALLEMVALDPTYARRRPHELSGGQQQRVALARALARKPDVMLLDEPFSALDSGLRAATRRAVAHTLRVAGVTSILVTHDQEEALSFADRVAVMRTGEFTQVGSPEEVYGEPVDRFTAEFLGDCVFLSGTATDGAAECALGRVPLRGNVPQRDVTIMLRPEQLIAKVVADGAGGVGVGTVVASEFLGSDVVLEIELPGDQPAITVRQASVLPPPIDAKVQIDVLGAAVAFAPDKN
ncbi:ABC transporter ATP-binding protein [Antrihabitans spumae]|uniref:ABC transporter ATP-binding protein n=1 Tax=Antrihabitans spumae TaxID=3373370 RepID=A0ABW7KPY3_9NOCA